MDSITKNNREGLEQAGVKILIYPPEKDLTDTQIAYQLARQRGACSVAVWGGTGSRLDHTLSTLHNAFWLVEHGIDMCFASPDVTINLLRDRLVLTGNPGDTVSLIVLGDAATGVTLKGFHYPLSHATIKGTWQFCVSNIMTEIHPVIEAASGNIAVFHHHVLPD